MVPVLVNVAFVTLMERKILGLSQLRLGPNKAGLQGILQPFSDAVKLFLKQWEKPVRRNNFLYLISPRVAIVITLMLWLIVPRTVDLFYSDLSIILFIIIISLGVYPLLLAGWASSRKYALVGRIRGVAQTISYEISLALIFIALIRILNNTRLKDFVWVSNQFYLILIGKLILILWVISIIAETNRTPFDFAEGESELVSGFNIEYGGPGFALIFIAEYGIILLLRGLTIAIFLGTPFFTFLHSFFTTRLAFFWIWVRATYPRYRYDLLISLAWKSFLPLILGAIRAQRCIAIIFWKNKLKKLKNFKFLYDLKSFFENLILLMSWTQFGLQDAFSPIIEEFHYFHDFTNSILIFILVFVGFMIASILNNVIINKNLLEGQLIECIWTLIPGIILIQIALPSLTLLYLLDDSPEASITVKAIGHQWYWEYEYSDHWSFKRAQGVKFDSYIIPERDLEKGIFRQLEVDNRLVLPSIIPVRVLISRADVLHAWTIPGLGVKADAIPGRLNQVNFFRLITGVLYGQCSEICGAQHSRIPIAVELIPASLFANWYESFSYSNVE